MINDFNIKHDVCLGTCFICRQSIKKHLNERINVYGLHDVYHVCSCDCAFKLSKSLKRLNVCRNNELF